MSALRIASAALTTVKLIDEIKDAIPVIPPPPVKSLAATTLCFVLCWRPGMRWRQLLEEGGAAAGAAMLLHDLQAVLSTTTDHNISRIMGQRTTR